MLAVGLVEGWWKARGGMFQYPCLIFSKAKRPGWSGGQ